MAGKADPLIGQRLTPFLLRSGQHPTPELVKPVDDQRKCEWGPGLHNANRYEKLDGPGITVSPVRATLTDSRPSCREAVLDAIDRLQRRTGATEFARRNIVAEVRAADAFERQTIYRCLRRLAGHEPGSAHHDLHDVGNDRLQVRQSRAKSPSRPLVSVVAPSFG